MKITLNYDNIASHNILTKEKLDIAKHPAKIKVLMGAKSSGKTFIAQVAALVGFEQYPSFNAFGIRKYKEQSSEKLADYFFSAYNMLQAQDFYFPVSYKQVSRGRKIMRNKYKRDTHKNQTLSFGSLEDTSSTSGTAPANGGVYSLVLVDEPLVEKDILNNNIPEYEDFKRLHNILVSDLERFHTSYKLVHPEDKVKPFELYYCLNIWGLHPLIQDANRIFPEEKFIYYIFQYNKDSKDSPITFQDLIGNEKLIAKWFSNPKNIQRLRTNTTMSVYHKETDTLYSRMTKFANPNNLEEKAFHETIYQIKMSLLLGNINELCITLGLEHKPQLDTEMLAFNIKDFNQTTFTELINEGFKPTDICYSVDVDTSRVFTITPTIRMQKETDMVFAKEIETRIFLDTQIEISAHGSGVHGELNEIYVKQIKSMIEEHFKFRKLFKYPLDVSHIAIDDKRKWFLNALMNEGVNYIKTYNTFLQHGDFNIIARQDWTHQGFDNKVLYINKANQALINDWETCQRDDIHTQKRKTTGRTNYLDRIDSAENGFLPFVFDIIQSTK